MKLNIEYVLSDDYSTTLYGKILCFQCFMFYENIRTSNAILFSFFVSNIFTISIIFNINTYLAAMLIM